MPTILYTRVNSRNGTPKQSFANPRELQVPLKDDNKGMSCHILWTNYLLKLDDGYDAFTITRS